MRKRFKIKKRLNQIEAEQFTDFILSTLDGITEKDQIVLIYLIQEVIYKFMVDNYDENYKLPGE